MIYSQKQIELLSDALRGSAEARQRLIEEAPELVMLEAALMTEKIALEWLMKNNKLLALFTDAVFGNKSAVKMLMAKKEYGLAAAANLTNGDDAAGIWLKNNNLIHYLKLAEGILYAHKNRGKPNQSPF